MNDSALRAAELTDANGLVTSPTSPIVCPMPVMASGADLLDPNLCQTLEDARCPLAADMQKRLAFEGLLTELSSRFVNVPAGEVDSQIQGGLRRIVELLGIDRCGFGEVSADGKQYTRLDRPERAETDMQRYWRDARLLRDNLLIYGLGGLLVPFIGIKVIDMFIAACGLSPTTTRSPRWFCGCRAQVARLWRPI